MKAVVLLISLMLAMAGFGCAALSHYVTPAEIDQQAVKYVAEAGVADQNEYDGYGNLVKSNKLMKDVDTAYVLNRQELDQAIQREDTNHSIHKKSTKFNHLASVQREEALFGEKGLLSMGLSLAGFSAFTGMLGLMRKRPGDITQGEMTQALTTATGKVNGEVSTKQKQFLQVVKGVKAFMEGKAADADTIVALQSAMNKAQDEETQVAVAVAKKKLPV